MSVQYICSRCKIERTKYDFHRLTRSPDTVRDGRQYRCKECVKEVNLMPETREKTRADNRRYFNKLKHEIFTHYSKGLLKCNCCDESEYSFLTLDHINNDGAAHRKEVGSGDHIWRDLRKNNYPEGYQILCFNCNLGKAKNEGVCPHMES